MEELLCSPVVKQQEGPRISRKYCMILVVFMVVALCILTTGIVLLALNAGVDCKAKRDKKSFIDDDYCEPSEEAKRIKLEEFLEKVKIAYFKLKPTAEFYFYQDANAEELHRIARKFKPFHPTPLFLKDLTDNLNALKEELRELKADKKKLKPSESQTLAEIYIFLDSFMAYKYDLDFYGGDWMLGPNYFCMNMICYLEYYLKEFLGKIPLRTKDDVQFVIDTFHGYKKTFKQYSINMQLGVKTGMVKSKSSCKAGADALREYYSGIINDKDGGSSWIIPHEFTTTLPKRVEIAWQRENNESVLISLKNALVSGFREPIIQLLKYLDEEHIRHCPPDDIASGLSSLPLNHVFLDGVPDANNRTTKKLPLTGGLLDGKEVYRKIVPRFTTTSISPEEIFAEGETQLKIFYGEMINATKIYTNESDENIAIQKMKVIMEGDDQWHGAKHFPKNESNENAYRKCKNDSEAQKYCPVRWKSNQIWTKYMYRLLGMIHPKLNKVFYFTGEKISTPNCPVKMINHYNPSNGAMYFDNSDAQCSRPGYFALPFFLERYGPKFQEWSVNGHEARPGHHIQLQGMLERFPFPCQQGLSGFFHSKSYFTSFVEGWALYGENPVLSHDVDLYKDNLLQKIGMYKWQVWRAIRLVVDTGLHYRNMNRTWALDMFAKYAWDKTDFARKEITRYMSCPGQATAYMVGRLSILKARQKAERELGDQFNLKDFHYQVLSLGQAPLDHVLDHINRYISCVKDSTIKYCGYILAPPSRSNIELVHHAETMPTHMHRHYL